MASNTTMRTPQDVLRKVLRIDPDNRSDGGAVWRFGRMRVIAGSLGVKTRLLTYRAPAAGSRRDWRHGLGWRAALLATWSVLATGAHSATLRAYSGGTTNEAVQLRGLIGPGDAGRLRDLVSAAAQAGRPFPSLSLDS